MRILEAIETFARWTDAVKSLCDGFETLKPREWDWRCDVITGIMKDFYAALPFHEGDRVEVVNDWISGAGSSVKAGPAIVKMIIYCPTRDEKPSRIMYSVVMDTEVWTRIDGTIDVMEDRHKHLLTHEADNLRLISRGS